jgi:hypothetical protein
VGEQQLGTSRRRSAEAPRSLWFEAPETDEEIRRTLTRERVVDQALTLIAQEGVPRTALDPADQGTRSSTAERPERPSWSRRPAENSRPPRPASLALAEAFLLPLHSAGFPHREAGLAFFLILDYTIGFEVSNPRLSINEQRVQDAATRKRLYEFFRSLPGNRFPTLIALGEHVWLGNRDERFTAGINALIDGLERAQRPPPS